MIFCFQFLYFFHLDLEENTIYQAIEDFLDIFGPKLYCGCLLDQLREVANSINCHFISNLSELNWAQLLRYSLVVIWIGFVLHHSFLYANFLVFRTNLMMPGVAASAG